MEYKTFQKYIPISPKKLHEVALLIKGLSPAQALERLSFSKKRGAIYLAKAIRVALANAFNQGEKEENLVFSKVEINQGPVLKRWKPASRGRVGHYKRKTSHIRVVLKSAKKEEEKK